jgi:hypothetical protein
MFPSKNQPKADGAESGRSDSGNMKIADNKANPDSADAR